MAEMDELQFRRILQGEIEAAVNYSDSEFSSERMDAMRYYLSEPFGNEVENRSQVVCSEVSDTINFMLPTLMKIFASSKEFCKGLGRPWEAMDLVTFGLGITTGTGWGGHTCTHALYMFTRTYAC